VDEDWSPVDLAGSRSSTESLLDGLWTGAIPYAVFPGFLDESECSGVVEALKTAPVTTFRSGDALVSTLGVYLPDAVTDPEAYFARAAELEPAIASVLEIGRGDVRDRIRFMFESHVNRPVVAATSPEGQEYGQGCFRVHGTGAGSSVHRDVVAVDAVGWNVAEMDSQFSCVLMLQPSEAGGELVVYRQRWQPEDDAEFKNKGAKGWDPRVVEGAQVVTYAAAAGDVYVFNPTQYHKIPLTSGESDRVSMQFFMAFDLDGDGPVVTFS
jgi:hypothetical protein